MEKRIHLGASTTPQASLSMKVIRGAEPVQFFGFVFVALVTLEIALLEGIPWFWLKAASYVAAFCGTFYATMLDTRVRNWLVKQLNKIKELERHQA